MPTIGRIGSLDVMMFRNDRDPPHFHVFGAAFSARFGIADCELLSSKGRIRGCDIRDVAACGQKQRNMQYLNWQLARDGEPAQRIAD